MIIVNIISLILCIIIFIIGYNNLKSAKNIKIEKEDRIFQIQNEINYLNKEKEELLEEIGKVRKNRFDNYEREAEKLYYNYERQRSEIEKKLSECKNNFSYGCEQYLYHLEKTYEKAEKEYNYKIKELKQNRDSAEEQLENIKNSLSAAVEARLREQEKMNKLEFYKLSVSSIELEDIQKLNNVKLSLHQPVILSKLIWSTYFLKQATDLCNRVLGKDKICGIYKITNLKTEQCYIGQSVGIADRWKEHIKCGLGIDASATNKLYKAMQTDGVWNFSFELIEKCSRTELNDKEKFWIDFYQSQKYGYNTTKGGS